MDFKVIVILFFLNGCAYAGNSRPENKDNLYFKNYSLSTCLADGYKSKEIISDASAAARGYLEFGELPLKAYTEATKLGRKYLQKEYKSKTDEKLILMKCLDFIHSKELDQILKKYK